MRFEKYLPDSGSGCRDTIHSQQSSNSSITRIRLRFLFTEQFRKLEKINTRTTL